MSRRSYYRHGEDVPSYLPEQDFLLPPSPREWLPEGHLAYLVSDLVDQLDLSAITTPGQDEERGYPLYHPVMLTKVLCTDTVSACSRRGRFTGE